MNITDHYSTFSTILCTVFIPLRDPIIILNDILRFIVSPKGTSRCSPHVYRYRRAPLYFPFSLSFSLSLSHLISYVTTLPYHPSPTHASFSELFSLHCNCHSSPRIINQSICSTIHPSTPHVLSSTSSHLVSPIVYWDCAIRLTPLGLSYDNVMPFMIIVKIGVFTNLLYFKRTYIRLESLNRFLDDRVRLLHI